MMSAQAARRRLLKKLITSGALGAGALHMRGWSAPVVQSIVLPVHAGMSGDTPLLVTDPCFLTVTCINGGTQVQVQAGGQIVGPPAAIGGISVSVTLRLMNGNSVAATAGPYNAITASNGSWGPLPVPAAVFDASLGNAVEGVVSSPDATFTPDRCRRPYICSSSPPKPPECDPNNWDRSSLSFNGLILCNTGDGPALCETRYEILCAPPGTPGGPQNGTVIASGVVGPLGDSGCHDFTSQVQSLCGECTGNLIVRAIQHPLHGLPNGGTPKNDDDNDLWSEAYSCGS